MRRSLWSSTRLSPRGESRRGAGGEHPEETTMRMASGALWLVMVGAAMGVGCSGEIGRAHV